MEVLVLAGRELRSRDRCCARHLPAAADVADEHQIAHRGRQRGVRIGGEIAEHARSGAFQRLDRASQRGGDDGEALVVRAQQVGLGRPHLRDERAYRGAVVRGELAPDQIGGLDTGGALVDRGDAGVAQVLARAGLLDVAHPAVDLDAERGDLDAELGAPRLQHRREQLDAVLAALALCRVRVAVGEVDVGRDDVAERAHRLDLRLHRHQHAAHVRVVDDGDAFAALAPGQPALHPLARVLARLLVGALGDSDALQARPSGAPRSSS